MNSTNNPAIGLEQDPLPQIDWERAAPLTPHDINLSVDLGRIGLRQTLQLLQDFFRFGTPNATAELEARLHETQAGIHAENLLDVIDIVLSTHPAPQPSGKSAAPADAAATTATATDGRRK